MGRRIRGHDEQQSKAANYQTGYMQGVADALIDFDDEMENTGDIRNARQAIKTLLRFGPQ